MNEPNKCIFCGTARAVMVPVDGGFFEETEKAWASVLTLHTFASGEKPLEVFTICPKCRVNKIETLYSRLIEEAAKEAQAIKEGITKGAREW